MKQIILQRWHTLNGYERLTLTGVALLAIASLSFVFIVDPLLMTIEKVDRQIARKQREVPELMALATAYEAARAQQLSIENRIAAAKNRLSLLSFLEDAASQAGVRSQIAAMTPLAPSLNQGYRESGVEIRLGGVLLSQILKMLVQIETAPYLVRIKRVQLKFKPDIAYLLDAMLVVVTYERDG
jgi:general secretion pathway protein M